MNAQKPEYWHCDNCNDTWTMWRGKDGWRNQCPDCGLPMQRVDETWVEGGDSVELEMVP